MHRQPEYDKEVHLQGLSPRRFAKDKTATRRADNTIEQCISDITGRT